MPHLPEILAEPPYKALSGGLFHEVQGDERHFSVAMGIQSLRCLPSSPMIIEKDAPQVAEAVHSIVKDNNGDLSFF